MSPVLLLFQFLFFRWGLMLSFPRLSTNYDPSTFVSWVSGITGLYCHSWPLWRPLLCDARMPSLVSFMLF
jgi:hypothetical protein